MITLHSTMLCLVALSLIACGSDKGTTPDPVVNHSISGKITATTATPATQGVVVRMGARTATTDAASAYRFDSIADGSYTVAPELVGRTFAPINRTVVVTGASVANIDFSLNDAAPSDDDSIYMVHVLVGTYLQGNHANQAHSEPFAAPKHQATLTRDLMVGIHEVTQSQWVRVMSTNLSPVVGPLHPVTMVSLDSVLLFCNRMSVLHGYTQVYAGPVGGMVADFDASGYRLPTEYEWEYAAQGGDTTLFPGISDQLVNTIDYDAYAIAVSAIAWFSHNIAGAGKAKEPQAVGGRQPNAYGMYDVCGNVTELTYSTRGYYQSDHLVDPVSPMPLVRSVGRGGNYTDDVDAITVRARRRGFSPRDFDFGTGFRVVRNQP